jgi:hypothetical protein
VAASALVAHRERRGLLFAWYTAVLTKQALCHPLLHVGTTMAFRTYSPGLASSLASRRCDGA